MKEGGGLFMIYDGQSKIVFYHPPESFKIGFTLLLYCFVNVGYLFIFRLQ